MNAGIHTDKQRDIQRDRQTWRNIYRETYIQTNRIVRGLRGVRGERHQAKGDRQTETYKQGDIETLRQTDKWTHRPTF